MTRTRGAGVRCGALALCAAVFLAAATGMKAQGLAPMGKKKPATVEALFVSDIHLDPFWDPSKVDHLKDAPVSEWKAILAGARGGRSRGAVCAARAGMQVARIAGHVLRTVCFEPARHQQGCERSEVCGAERRPDGA